MEYKIIEDTFCHYGGFGFGTINELKGIFKYERNLEQ